MTPPPGPCWRCGSPGARSVGVRSYCGEHLRELFDTFDPALWATNGVGVPHGGQRPEVGPAVGELVCVACGATWVGLAGERCQWCRAHRERIIAHQREILLAVPDVAEGDFADRVLLAWGERLRRGVDAGIVTRDEARRVWRRAGQHAA